MSQATNQDQQKILFLYRWLLFGAGTIYLIWWELVHLLLPNSFNPLPSRLVVVAFIFLCLGLTYLNGWVRRHVKLVFLTCAWLITLHYYYLFYENGGDINWIIGCYITVIAINLCLMSNVSLLAYSIFVTLLSVFLLYELPILRESVFLPGLITLLVQANIGSRSRLTMIKSLAASNHRFQLLFHSTFEGILVHEQGRVVNINESLRRILGYSEKDLIGTDVMDLITPADRPAVRERLKLDEVAYETRGLSKNGREVEIEVRSKNFVYDNRIARLVTVQDIRDRKRMEKERITALALAENVRVRDEFISIASHELKTPISILKLQAQIIEKDLRKGQTFSSERIDETIGLFERQTDRLTELVETMLDVSRISSGRLTLEIARVDLAELLRETVRALQPQLKETGSKVELLLPDSCFIQADRARLEQVFVNLISNAAKYGDRKPIKIELVPGTTDVVIRFTDHGIGIAAESIPKIFDRFERAISARNISGFGLGLYIVKQILQAHRGSVSVVSHLGDGSTFTVRLPVNQPGTNTKSDIV